jgi:hypothetical protein
MGQLSLYRSLDLWRMAVAHSPGRLSAAPDSLTSDCCKRAAKGRLGPLVLRPTLTRQVLDPAASARLEIVSAAAPRVDGAHSLRWTWEILPTLA